MTNPSESRAYSFNYLLLFHLSLLGFYIGPNISTHREGKLNSLYICSEKVYLSLEEPWESWYHNTFKIRKSHLLSLSLTQLELKSQPYRSLAAWLGQVTFLNFFICNVKNIRVSTLSIEWTSACQGLRKVPVI